MKSRFNKIVANPFLLFIWLAISLLVLCTPALTLADSDQATVRDLRTSGQILPLEKIHAKAKTIKVGKILETDLEVKNGQYIYEIELLDDKGIVWEIKLDAKTGQFIKLEED